MERWRQRPLQPRASEMKALESKPTGTPFLPPNIDLICFYGEHSERRDFTPLRDLLVSTKPDVLVMEIAGWNVEELALTSRVLQGDKRAQKQLDELVKGGLNPFSKAKLDHLRGSGMRFTVIDYGTGDERGEEILEHFDNWGLLDKLQPDFKQSLDNIIDYARREADLEQYREDLMVKNVGPRLQALLEDDEDLRAKDRVTVIVQAGAYHVGMYPRLEELAEQSGGATIQKVENRSQIEIEHFDRLTLAFRAGTQLTLAQQRELAARALARTALRFNGIPLVMKDSDRGLPPPEEMVERFSMESIRDFHRRVIEAQAKRK